MAMANKPVGSSNYDPRWFIWCIVFLVGAGVGLTAYITLSGDNSADAAGLPVVHHKTVKK